jgi:hypothetical protein
MTTNDDDSGGPIKGDPSYAQRRPPDPDAEPFGELTPDEFFAAVGKASDGHGPHDTPLGMKWEFSFMYGPPREVIGTADGGTLDPKTMTPQKFKSLMAKWRLDNTRLVWDKSANASDAQREAATAGWEAQLLHGEIHSIDFRSGAAMEHKSMGLAEYQAESSRLWWIDHPRDKPKDAEQTETAAEIMARRRAGGTHTLQRNPMPDDATMNPIAKMTPAEWRQYEYDRRRGTVVIPPEGSAKQTTETTSPPFRGVKV